jgi:hypothetical protein
MSKIILADGAKFPKGFEMSQVPGSMTKQIADAISGMGGMDLDTMMTWTKEALEKAVQAKSMDEQTKKQWENIFGRSQTSGQLLHTLKNFMLAGMGLRVISSLEETEDAGTEKLGMGFGVYPTTAGDVAVYMEKRLGEDPRDVWDDAVQLFGVPYKFAKDVWFELKKGASTRKIKGAEYGQVSNFMKDMIGKRSKETLIADAIELFGVDPADAEYVYGEVDKALRKGLASQKISAMRELLGFFWSNPSLKRDEAIAAAMNLFGVDYEDAEAAFAAALDVPRIGEASKTASEEIFKMAISDAAQEWISNKIRKLREEGKDEEQAAAIAYSTAREKGYEVPEKRGSKTAAMTFEELWHFIQTLPPEQQAQLYRKISESFGQRVKGKRINALLETVAKDKGCMKKDKRPKKKSVDNEAKKVYKNYLAGTGYDQQIAKVSSQKTALDPFAKEYWSKVIQEMGGDPKTIKAARLKVEAVLSHEGEMKPIDFKAAYDGLAKEFEKEGGLKFVRGVRGALIKERIETGELIKKIRV